MKNRLNLVLLILAVFSVTSLMPREARAQACDEDEGMVETYRKDLTEMVDTTRKESLEEFEKAFHQKSCLTKLSLSIGMVDELVNCLDKASQDSAASKEQSEAYKAKRESYAKLKESIEEDRKQLKAADTSKSAKAQIEKFDFSK